MTSYWLTIGVTIPIYHNWLNISNFLWFIQMLLVRPCLWPLRNQGSSKPAYFWAKVLSWDWSQKLIKYIDIQLTVENDTDGKESICSAGDLSSIPRLGRSPGEGNGNPLQYSCLENFTDRGVWGATVHGVTKSQTQLSDWHFFSTFHPLETVT